MWYCSLEFASVVWKQIVEAHMQPAHLKLIYALAIGHLTPQPPMQSRILLQAGAAPPAADRVGVRVETKTISCVPCAPLLAVHAWTADCAELSLRVRHEEFAEGWSPPHGFEVLQ